MNTALMDVHVVLTSEGLVANFTAKLWLFAAAKLCVSPESAAMCV